jgi:hypothetical protein
VALVMAVAMVVAVVVMAVAVAVAVAVLLLLRPQQLLQRLPWPLHPPRYLCQLMLACVFVPVQPASAFSPRQRSPSNRQRLRQQEAPTLRQDDRRVEC